MIDAIINFFYGLALIIGLCFAVFCAIYVAIENQKYNNSDDDYEDDDDDDDTRYIIEATNNTNLGYMKVGSSAYEASAIRAAESYLRNGRSGYRARVVEVVNGKRRGTVWTS